MDLQHRNRRASRAGQRRLDDATEDERDVEHVVDAEPDYETQLTDRAERRAMRGTP